jgi:hypothetical protein
MTSEPAERIRLAWNAIAPTDISRAELISLHELLIEEYRFQVKLNSDRTQSYLTLNAAIVTVAATLLKFGGENASFLVAGVLIPGCYIALLSAKAVNQGHRYYRAVVYKKTLVENLLGRTRPIEGHAFEGATLAVETTVGMSSEREILQNAAEWLARPIRSETITGGLIRVFYLFAGVDAVGTLLLIAQAIL